MKAMKTIATVVLLLTILGCGGEKSFQPNTFTKDDMCITPIDAGKQNICYGMARPDVENLLGPGQLDDFAFTEYEHGVSVMYRNDVVVGLALEQGSQGMYTTARGAEIGMSKEDIKVLYGDKHAVEQGERNLDYFYDSVNQTFMTQLPSLANQTREDMESTYILSVIMDSAAELAERIMLLDMRMAVYME